MIKCTHPEKMKNTFDRRVKEEQFQIDDLVLKWDAPKEDRHENFDHMWIGLMLLQVTEGKMHLFWSIRMGFLWRVTLSMEYF